ncbi:response regulator [uncultured Methanofollis sp.]|uniref:response regulator n=1 Tax=uncultured Methanofollis sp. TaxID=262500 RepID=UPI00261EC494|nr:response regulator [uncultured Methanofollis sp.]
MKVLVVEDAAIIALDIANRVRRLGHMVTGTAATADIALEKARETSPDVALMDINLKGGRDGVDAASLLAEELGIRCIFVTAYSDRDMRERALATRPLGYIVKPIRDAELKEALAAAATALGLDD